MCQKDLFLKLEVASWMVGGLGDMYGLKWVSFSRGHDGLPTKTNLEEQGFTN